MNPAYGRGMERARARDRAKNRNLLPGYYTLERRFPELGPRPDEEDEKWWLEPDTPRSSRTEIAARAVQSRQAPPPAQGDSDGRWVTIDGRHVFIQEGAAGGERPEATRQRIAKTAKKYGGSTAWAYGKRKDNFPAGTNKCNKFVYDVTKEAGAPAVVIGSDGKPRAPLAAEWAAPRVRIPGWRVLGPNEKPQPGDVAAWPHHYSDATGHSGVVVAVDPNGHVAAIAAHYDQVGRDSTFNRSHDRPNVTYRRYIGE